MLGTVAPSKLSNDDFKWFQSWLMESSAIVMEDGRKFVAEKRLHALLWKHKIPSFGQLCAYLKQGQVEDLNADVIEAITGNETWFYRDPAYFDQLRNQILPELINARSAKRELRIWSAGCGSGQEAYSLAMLLGELPQLKGWKLTLLGSDISKRHIERARQGIYTRDEVNRGLPAAQLTRYFQQDGLVWTARPELKEKVQFEVLGLHEPWPPKEAFDLVLMRNVLFHFNESSRTELCWRMRKQLALGGYLMLGSNEENWFKECYEEVRTEKSLCFRHTSL